MRLLFSDAMASGLAIAQRLPRPRLRTRTGLPHLQQSRLAPIAPPELPLEVHAELLAGQRLTDLDNGLQCHVCKTPAATPLLLEIARLRELTFRAIGEGSGRNRDFDRFDHWYDHIVLWDAGRQQIVGAYRVKRTDDLAGKQSLYTASLFEFQPAAADVLTYGVEMGRSFIRPEAQGRNALDYLWQGLGRYLAAFPDLHYSFGAVTLSADIPTPARQSIVEFFLTHCGHQAALAVARNPYRVSMTGQFGQADYRTELRLLKSQLTALDVRLPPLFKQYVELCEPGGTRFSDFGIDPDFSHCVDGLVVSDLTTIRPAKRRRYFGQ